MEDSRGRQHPQDEARVMTVQDAITKLHAILEAEEEAEGFPGAMFQLELICLDPHEIGWDRLRRILRLHEQYDIEIVSGRLVAWPTGNDPDELIWYPDVREWLSTQQAVERGLREED